ncbi:MAG: AbrB/MazE/SpoVT family DNA-binding domain-containing protein [Candidatus Nanoarchaeia archaeon]
MVSELFELGSVSSRGQIAIPSNMRKELGLLEGTRILFVVDNDSIIMKKVTSETFAKITKPLRNANKKINEDDVVNLIHKIRKTKNVKGNTRH